MLIIVFEKDGSDYPVDKDLGAHGRINHQERQDWSWKWPIMQFPGISLTDEGIDLR